MNYIYIDTKIEGTIHQLIEYFHFGVFDTNNFLVYYKQYQKETKLFSRIFARAGIKGIGFRKYSEVKIENGSVVFYLFNAQSNCRMVANRNVKHVFVTHGESNKISSIKPIIRIYDYVITAGQIGVQRYLDSGIFFPEDVARNRIIMMGDTFIGDNCYTYDPQSNTILYAPTWEGGIPEENYTSLEWNNIFDKLVNYCNVTGIKDVVIQTHPNLGHRDNKYVSILYRGMQQLLRRGFSITIIKDYKNWTDFRLLCFYPNLFKVKNRQQNIKIKEAFCDISAMEAQLYANMIPTKVFLKDSVQLKNKELCDHYKKIGVTETQNIKQINYFDQSYFQELFSMTFVKWKKAAKQKRVSYLITFILQH